MFQNLEPWRNSIWIISVNNQTHNNSYSKSHYSIIFFWFQKTTKQFLSNKYTISTLKMAFTIFTPPKLLTMPQVIYWRTWQWKYVIDCQRPFIFHFFFFFKTQLSTVCVTMKEYPQIRYLENSPNKLARRLAVYLQDSLDELIKKATDYNSTTGK